VVAGAEKRKTGWNTGLVIVGFLYRK
jgi:hypothetical protein